MRVASRWRLTAAQSGCMGVFGLGPSVDLAGCVVGSVPRWDSLGHLKLMMEVERSLRVRLPAEVLAKIQSYRDLERAVRAQLSAL